MATPKSDSGSSVSQHSREKAEAAKAYITNKYSKLKEQEEQKAAGWRELQEKMEAMNLSHTEQQLIRSEIMQSEAAQQRQSRRKVTIYDYEPVAVIGKGAFGEVRIVRDRDSGSVYALKKLSKTEMIYKNQVVHVKSERDVMAKAHNPWIVELACSFQDEQYLYLVMEYLPGGDLMTLLMRKDVLSEEEARFYTAEIVLAIESVHELNYIHRDLKPDNVLLDIEGHVKLSDFGLCTRAEIQPSNLYANLTKLEEVKTQSSKQAAASVSSARRRKLAFSTVGTPDYIAPEVFGKNGYNELADWWSVGVMLFEMLVGFPPFFADDPSVTCQKVIHWKKTLYFPEEIIVSPVAQDLIRNLVCDPEDRLGRDGVHQIKNHPFFTGIQWDMIRQRQAPNVPALQSNIDTRYFDKFDETEPFYPVENTAKHSRQRHNANFIGFTYKRDMDDQQPRLISAIQELDQACPKST